MKDHVTHALKPEVVDYKVEEDAVGAHLWEREGILEDRLALRVLVCSVVQLQIVARARILVFEQRAGND